MRSALEQRSSRDLPGPVGLQTAGEMIVLSVNRRAARAHRIFDFLALLFFPSEFFTQLDEPRISRSGIAPLSQSYVRFQVGSNWACAAPAINNPATNGISTLAGGDIPFPFRKWYRRTVHNMLPFRADEEGITVPRTLT